LEEGFFMSRRPRLLRLLVPALLVASAVFASAASAEMPSNRDAPTITEVGGPVVGETLLGNNGTWLYDDGSPCRGECAYAFLWQRCNPGGDCAVIPGGAERAYRVGAADVGRSLRVVVNATKYDCNAHGRDCRHVTRTAVSAQTPPVAAPTAPPVRLTIARVGVERARRGVVVAVTVKDDRGNAVRAARVTVRGSSRLTGTTGSARFAVRSAPRASAVTLVVHAEKAGAEPAALEVRLPLAR
jgi:hypothetical protein